MKAVKEKIEAEEEKFDFAILDDVVLNAQNMDIRVIAQQSEQQVTEVEMVSELSATDVVLDIRSPDEQEAHPLKIEERKCAHCRSTSSALSSVIYRRRPLICSTAIAG